MIFKTKDKTGFWRDDAPSCPFSNEPCKMGDCACFEWVKQFDGPRFEAGYCGFTKAASYADGLMVGRRFEACE